MQIQPIYYQDSYYLFQAYSFTENMPTQLFVIPTTFLMLTLHGTGKIVEKFPPVIKTTRYMVCKSVL